MSDSLPYKVHDRSVLLPFYKQYFIDSTIRFVPNTINPNLITLVGHLSNFIGMLLLLVLWPTNGWPFLFAIVAMHIYNWCDNADGAHARRTGQCSIMGEFLDHGLDLLNTIYLVSMGAIATHASPMWWVTCCVVVPSVTAVAYWEQTHTGTLQIAQLHQIESVALLTIVMLISAFWGTDTFTNVTLGPLDLRAAILSFLIATSMVTILGSIRRVAHQSWQQVRSIVPLLMFNLAILVAAAFHALTTVSAIAIATSANVFFGLRMLSDRIRGGKPQIEVGLIIATLCTIAITLWQLMISDIANHTQILLTVFACLFFGGSSLGLAHDGIQRVANLEHPNCPIQLRRIFQRKQ